MVAGERAQHRVTTMLDRHMTFSQHKALLATARLDCRESRNKAAVCGWLPLGLPTSRLLSICLATANLSFRRTCVRSDRRAFFRTQPWEIPGQRPAVMGVPAGLGAAQEAGARPAIPTSHQRHPTS